MVKQLSIESLQLYRSSNYNKTLLMDIPIVERNVLHINGIKDQSLYRKIPFFETSTMLPQCSSHDYLGLVHKSFRAVFYNENNFLFFSLVMKEYLVEVLLQDAVLLSFAFLF